MKKLILLCGLCAFAAFASISSGDEPETPVYPYTVTIEDVAYEVLAPDGEPGYRVRLADGQVTAFPAASGEPSPENAAADIAAAIASPITMAPVPESVARRQLKEWLIRNDKLAAVQAVLAAIVDPTEKAIAANWWEESEPFRRAHPLVASVGTALGMTTAEIDQAFREAAAL